MVNLGEAIGVIAAQSIGEPGTQLTMRTFHIGGTASRRAEQTTLEARNDGIVKFINLNTVDEQGRRPGRHEPQRRGRDRRRAPSRAASASASATRSSTAPSSRSSDGEQGEGRRAARRVGPVHHPDPHRGRRHREVRRHHRRRDDGGAGRRAHRPLDQGHHRHARTSTSGRASRSRTRTARPRGCRLGERGALPAARSARTSTSPKGSRSSPGDVIAKIPRETTKTKDITGGLPRVAELFEARKPKEFAVISEIDGVVSFGKDTKGKRKVVVTPEVGEPREYLIPKGKHISVHEGDFVRAGEPLMDGCSNPHDILTILGEKALAKYLVDEVQEIYRLQGVRINDKHIEVIVRQMLRRVRIKEVGDTDFLIGDQVEKWRFEEENQRVLERAAAQPAIAEPLLLGITKASLSTESFISAASFQETTKVLTEAAINGKVDRLLGLKENVIMGRLIPAGTGRHALQPDGGRVDRRAPRQLRRGAGCRGCSREAVGLTR